MSIVAMQRVSLCGLLREKAAALEGLQALGVMHLVPLRARERLALLEAAVVKITQRVNLFDKVLVPQTLDNIRRINVFLGDAERSAVVGAKIAKRKREEQVGT